LSVKYTSREKPGYHETSQVCLLGSTQYFKFKSAFKELSNDLTNITFIINWG